MKPKEGSGIISLLFICIMVGNGIITSSGIGHADEELPVNTSLVGNVADGEKIYKKICVICHGRGGDPTAPGAGGLKIAANFAKPELNPPRIKAIFDHLTVEQHSRIIKYGGAKSGVPGAGPQMPPYGKVLSDQDIADIIAYDRATFPAFKNEK